MLLHSRVIYYQLSKEYDCVYKYRQPDQTLDTPMFYNRLGKNAGHLIVFSRDVDIRVLQSEQIACYLCFEEDAEKFDSLHSNGIVLRSDAPIEEVFNALLRIFNRFNAWESKMTGMIQQISLFSKLIDCCDDFIEDPIALMDAQFNYVGYSKLSEERGMVSRFVDNNRLKLDVAQQLAASPEFKKAKLNRDVYDYMSETYLFVKNIFHRENYVGRVMLPVSGIEARDEYQKCFLEYLGSFIEELYRRCGSFSRDLPGVEKFKNMLIHLLNAQTVEAEEITTVLMESGNSPEDEYYLLQFRTNLSLDIASYFPYLIKQLETAWPGSVAFEYEGRLFHLINETKFLQATGTKVFDPLPYFLRDTLLVAGISRKVKTISYIRTALKQSGIALDFGHSKNPTFWYFKFDDYAYMYFLEKGLDGFRPCDICSLDILALTEHDKEHNTQYYDTVYQYIKNRFNASAAAKSLYIVRSSFLNRMERIAELINVDWDNFDARLYMEISCKLLDN